MFGRRCVRCPLRAHTISELLLQFFPEMVAQISHTIHWREVAGKRAGLAEADRKQCALGTSSTTTFVSGTMN